MSSDQADQRSAKKRTNKAKSISKQWKQKTNAVTRCRISSPPPLPPFQANLYGIKIIRFAGHALRVRLRPKSRVRKKKKKACRNKQTRARQETQICSRREVGRRSTQNDSRCAVDNIVDSGWEAFLKKRLIQQLQSRTWTRKERERERTGGEPFRCILVFFDLKWNLKLNLSNGWEMVLNANFHHHCPPPHWPWSDRWLAVHSICRQEREPAKKQLHLYVPDLGVVWWRLLMIFNVPDDSDVVSVASVPIRNKNYLDSILDGLFPGLFVSVGYRWVDIPNTKRLKNTLFSENSEKCPKKGSWRFECAVFHPPSSREADKPGSNRQRKAFSWNDFFNFLSFAKDTLCVALPVFSPISKWRTNSIEPSSDDDGNIFLSFGWFHLERLNRIDVITLLLVKGLHTRSSKRVISESLGWRPSFYFPN